MSSKPRTASPCSVLVNVRDTVVEELRFNLLIDTLSKPRRTFDH